MRKLILLAAFILCATPLTFAQTTTGDYDKVNVFAGFSHNRVDTGISDNDPDLSDIVDEREGFNGFNASVTGNVSRYVGLKFDYSFHRNDQDFGQALPGFGLKTDLHNFLGGVQIKDNAKTGTVKPFAHALIGAAHARFDVRGLTPAQQAAFDIDDSDTGFAAAIGGGLDFRLNDRLDLRAVQVDYNPTRLGDETQHNFRIGIGIVIK